MDKEDKEKQIEEITKEKERLEELLEKKELSRMNRGMQTKHIKMKERENQTEGGHGGGLTSFGQISDGAEHFIGADGADTQHSTNMNLTQDMYPGKPSGRVQSAHRGKVDGSFSNIMSHQGPS